MKRAARFVFYKDAQGMHRWRCVAGNGRTLADSGEGYKRRGAAEKALELVLSADYRPMNTPLDS